MRVAKIRRGSRYAEAGFTHVFRFDQGRVHDDKYDRIIAALKKIYGNRRWRHVPLTLVCVYAGQIFDER